MFAIFWGVELEIGGMLECYMGMIQYCIHAIFTSHTSTLLNNKKKVHEVVGDLVHMICVSESSGRYGLRRRNWELRLTGFNHFWKEMTSM